MVKVRYSGMMLLLALTLLNICAADKVGTPAWQRFQRQLDAITPDSPVVASGRMPTKSVDYSGVALLDLPASPRTTSSVGGATNSQTPQAHFGTPSSCRVAAQCKPASSQSSRVASTSQGASSEAVSADAEQLRVLQQKMLVMQQTIDFQESAARSEVKKLSQQFQENLETQERTIEAIQGQLANARVRLNELNTQGQMKEAELERSQADRVQLLGCLDAVNRTANKEYIKAELVTERLKVCTQDFRQSAELLKTSNEKWDRATNALANEQANTAHLTTELKAERSYKWLKYATCAAAGVVATLVVQSKPVRSLIASVLCKFKFW